MKNVSPDAASAAGNEAGSGWSGKELDEIPVSRHHDSRRETAGVSDSELHSAAMFFGLIVLLFIAIGISLLRVVPARDGGEILNCVQIRADAERLTCYDKAAASAASPFKGGSPFSSYSRSDYEGAS